MNMKTKTSWVFLTLFAIAIVSAIPVFAGTITQNQVRLSSGGETVTYDFDEVKTEVENGVTKVCICRCLCFRALQMLATRFEDGVIPKDDIEIVTGWTTDGPEELFVEVMGWPHESLTFTQNATESSLLTIADAVFFFIQKSTDKAWKVAANEGLYPTAFFPYRTAVKEKTASEEETDFFKMALRPQAVSHMETLPMIDRFRVDAVSFFGKESVLRIPACVISDGTEYSIELLCKGEGVFHLLKAETIPE